MGARVEPDERYNRRSAVPSPRCEAWLACAGLVLALVATMPIAAAAQTSRTETTEACIADLTDEEVFEQLLDLQHSFAEQRAGAISWWTGWTGFNLFNILYGTYKTATANTRLAFDSWLVSVIGAGLFVADVVVLPMPGMYAYRRFRTWPDHTPDERRLKLMLGLELLDRAAKVERLNSNLWAQFTAFVYATLSTGYVWIRNTGAPADKLTLALTLQFVTSIAVAEVTFLTVPRRGRRDRAKAHEAVCAPQRTARATQSPRVAWSVGVGVGQMGLFARF